MINKLAQFIYNHYITSLLVMISLFTCFDMVTTYLEFGRLYYSDTDPYTRALRIFDWLNDFQWAEKVFPFSNPPDGEILHFTRIADLIWTVFTLPFLFFYPLKDSVFYGGMFFSPFFFFLSTVTACRGIRPYLQKSEHKETYFVLVLAFFLCIIYQYTGIFSFTRPDHHSLMFFIFCFNITTLLFALKSPQKASFLTAGLLTGCGIWSSSAVEGFFLLGSILSCDILLWFLNDLQSKSLYRYTAGLCFSVCLAFALNPPYGGYLVFDNLRLSLIHVVTCVCIFLSFGCIHMLHPQTKIHKLFVLSGCALSSAAVLLLVFGVSTIFAPIYHPNIKLYFLPHISEMRSPLLTVPLVCIPFYLMSAYILLKNIRQAYTQKHIAVLCFFSLWYFIPACLTYRFLWYLIVPIGYLFFLSLYRLLASIKKTHRRKIRAFGVIIFLLFMLTTFHSDVSPITYNIPPIKGTVLTGMFAGPQLAFENDVFTVTSPYHTNISSITDNYKLFYSDDENELKELIKKHQVTYVYLPTHKKAEYSPNQLRKKNITNQILSGRQDYPWLIKVSSETDGYVLYRIDPQLL